MHKLIAAAIASVAALAVTAPALAESAAPTSHEDVTYDKNYARDRAEIEDLQARYLFALDWQDGPAYAATFTEDGVLDWAGGVVKGRAAIEKEVAGMRAAFARREAVDAPRRPARLRHFITNIVIKVDGDRATGRAFWFEFNNDTRDRWPYTGGYGHYEDELRRVNGHWLFSKRKIYNEFLENRIAPDKNPAW